MSRIYGNGGNSSIGGEQFNDFFYQKKALVESRKKQFFMQLSDTTNLPKNMGKTLKRYHYLPMLDDANVNDQGIDANGASTAQKVTIVVTRADGTAPNVPFDNGTYSPSNKAYIVGTGATAALAEDDAVAKAVDWASSATNAGGLGLALTQAVSYDADFATMVTTGGASAYDEGFRFTQLDGTTITAAAGALEAQAIPDYGNLYGSSKDVGTMTAKMPVLAEGGGRVNRVGFTRIQLEGSIEKYGFFDEYTKESVDFDTDPQLQMHVNRTMVDAAVEITEDLLQIDLLNAAGVVRYPGAATQDTDLTGEGTPSVPTFDDLLQLNIDLDNNRCPKDTELITGSRNTDTNTVNSARYAYIGSELIKTVKKMTDISGTGTGSGFISVEKYGDASKIARGEIGQVDQFKFIVAPEMAHWAGAGGAVSTNGGYHETQGNYDVFPILVVGSGSFQTIGFQTDGKSVKFKIKHAKPESVEAYGPENPFGEVGFMSIKWYYGTMILRPEWIALIKCVAAY